MSVLTVDGLSHRPTPDPCGSLTTACGRADRVVPIVANTVSCPACRRRP